MIGYHKLLEDLNAGADGSGPFLDRQVAVIYELRNFPDYWPVSLRVPRASLPRWKQQKLQGALVTPLLGGSLSTVYDKALLTTDFIKRRQLEKNYLCIADEDR